MVRVVAQSKSSIHMIVKAVVQYLLDQESLIMVFFLLRYEAAILMLMLGKDGEAYNFIKFWLSQSRIKFNEKIHSQFMITETFEGGPFLTNFTMIGQGLYEKIPLVKIPLSFCV